MAQMTPEEALVELPKWAEHFEWRYVAEHYEPCLMLDFGCGYGFSDFYLSDRGFRVEGYDPDSEKIVAAVCMFKQMGKSFRFSARGIYPDYYCLVWISHVLEHIPVDRWSTEVFQKIGASCLARPQFLVSVPLGHAYDMPEHVNHWTTADDLRRDLENASGLVWTVWTDEEHQVIKAAHYEV